jgi:hypothetical protein
MWVGGGDCVCGGMLGARHIPKPFCMHSPSHSSHRLCTVSSRTRLSYLFRCFGVSVEGPTIMELCMSHLLSDSPPCFSPPCSHFALSRRLGQRCLITKARRCPAIVGTSILVPLEIYPGYGDPSVTQFPVADCLPPSTEFPLPPPTPPSSSSFWNHWLSLVVT